MKKKFVSVTVLMIAVLIMLSAVFTGCRKKEDNKEDTSTNTVNTSANDSDSEVVKDNLPDKDMGGFELVILNYTDAAHGYSIKTMVVDKDSDSVIDSAIYYRNIAVKERFDCEISEIQQDRPYDIMRNDATVGIAEYNIAFLYEEHINRVLVAGALKSFGELSYCDLSREYWNQDANAVYSINGYQYAAVGDWSLSTYSKAYCYLMNKDVLATQNTEYNVYELVRNHEWTLDKMFQVAADYTQEMDGEPGWTAGDQYGIVGTSKVHYQLLLSGSGIKFVDKNESGVPYFAFSGQHVTEVVDKILELNSTPSYYNNNDSYNGGVVTTEFMNNRALFLASTLNGIVRENNVTVGIIPAPLYNTDQENYMTIEVGGLLTCIPSTLKSEDTENVSMIVEALCCASCNDVIPKYKETILKTQIADTEDDAEMIDILFSTMVYDLGCSTWANDIRLSIMNNVFHTRNKGWTSFIAAMTPSINGTISDTVTAINGFIE